MVNTAKTFDAKRENLRKDFDLIKMIIIILQKIFLRKKISRRFYSAVDFEKDFPSRDMRAIF